MRLGAGLAGHLDQPVRVRGVLRPDDEHQIAPRRQRLDRFLAVLARVADVVVAGTNHRREAPAEGLDHLDGVVDGKGRLREVGHLLRVRGGNRVDVVRPLDDHDLIGGLPRGALDLLVAGVADEEDRAATPGEALGLDVDLGHQRAGGIDNPQVPATGVLVHRR